MTEPDPEDRPPQKAPLIRREADGREIQVFSVDYAAAGVVCASFLIVRRHPGTDEITLMLSPKGETP